MENLGKKLIVEEVTPSNYKCTHGACPSIFKTNRNTFIVIGATTVDIQENSTLKEKVGLNEKAVEVPYDMIMKFILESSL